MESTTCTSGMELIGLKKIVVLGIVASSLALTVGCVGGRTTASTRKSPVAASTSRTTSADLATPDEQSGGLATVSVQMDGGDLYPTVGQLVESRYLDLIVRGKVLATEYVYSHEGAWTKCTVKVSKSWSPGVVAGDVITVVEMGGITSLANLKRDAHAGDLSAPANLKRDPDNPTNNSISASDETSMVAMIFDAQPLAKVGQESIYFLARGELGVVPGEYYGTIGGGSQGKFLIGQGVARRNESPEQPSSAIDVVDVVTMESSIRKAVGHAASDRAAK